MVAVHSYHVPLVPGAPVVPHYLLFHIRNSCYACDFVFPKNGCFFRLFFGYSVVSARDPGCKQLRLSGCLTSHSHSATSCTLYLFSFVFVILFSITLCDPVCVGLAWKHMLYHVICFLCSSWASDSGEVLSVAYGGSEVTRCSLGKQCSILSSGTAHCQIGWIALQLQQEHKAH